jgi:uncharacterized membrane protein YdjX (TVP38/TMEM64 family)
MGVIVTRTGFRAVGDSYPPCMPSLRIRALAALVPAAVVAAAVLLPHSPAALRELLLSAGPAAPFTALAAWIVLTPALFPGTLLAAAGGLAFGAGAGAALAFGGAVAGGLAAFALARSAASGAADRLATRSARFARIAALFERRGFAAVLAARLTPGVPATGLHYLAGAARVRPGSFIAAIAVAAPLRTVPYAVLGTGVASGSILTLVVAGSSIAFGAIASAVLVRHSLQEALAGA